MIEFMVKEVVHLSGHRSYMVYRSDLQMAMAHVHRKEDADMICTALQFQESITSLTELSFKHRREE